MERTMRQAGPPRQDRHPTKMPVLAAGRLKAPCVHRALACCLSVLFSGHRCTPRPHRVRSGLSVSTAPPWLIFIKESGLRIGSRHLIPGDSCDRFRRYLPVHLPVRSSSWRRRPQPKRACSSSPTMPTATASTSAWPRAKSAAHWPPAPIANHVILHSPPPFVASIPRKSRVQCRKTAQIARAAAATNMSRSPANGKTRLSTGFLPYLRRGNDVTLPPEAAM
jgi:hypothetical protein